MLPRRPDRRLSRPLPLVLLAALAAGCAGAEGASAGPDIGALLASNAPSAQGSPGRFRPNGGFGAYLAGRFAASESDTGPAAEQLLRAERLAPQDEEVVRSAFLAAVLDGRAEALRLARRLPDNPVAVLLVAGAEAQAGRWDRAEAQLRALPQQQDGIAVLQPLLLAWVQAGRGQPDQALAALRPLVEGGRARALGALHGAMIADLAGRGPEALRLSRLSLAETGEPNLRQIQVAGGILLRRGAEAEALRLGQRLPRGAEDAALLTAGGEASLRALFADPPVASAVEGIAEAKIAFAGALRGQGAGEFSLAMARLALRLRPASAPALLLAAEALAEERQNAAALALLQRIPEADPLAPIGTLRRAAVLARMDRTEEAEALLRELAAARPSAPQPWARLGDILRERRRFAEALAAYDAAVARLEGVRAADWTLFYARGIAAERAGQWPRAEADFRRALELSPDQPYVLNYLAYSWVEQGRNLEEARRMLERAVALRPRDGNIVDSLGWAHFRLGDIPRAVELLERAVELEPRNATINDHLGDAYWMAGRLAEARFQWRRALGLDPEPEEAERIERKLREGLAAVAR
ncbi:MAG: tetratricopeptide repeat protein [Acetobacteraceae bacterium]|nr:tetratricopeptide repeat protein [Acetobacteraceae bacterium]MCX7685067.1 tetratricopeptide repeat protein [Acetobacteraceae bacterium]MDW8398352.1 tetratricopeptide repeat protein [Acetobacteraceae bacterium]